MTPSTPWPPSLPRRPSSGAVTVFVAAMLVVLAGLSGVYALKSVLFEQKDANNHYWGSQAHEAAQSGVEHGLAWLKLTYTSATPPTFWQPPSSSLCPPGLAGLQYQCYNLSTHPGVNTDLEVGDITYTVTVRLARDIVRSPNVATISAIAENTANLAQTEVRQNVYIPTIPPGPTEPPPPLIVSGCISAVTGNPDICPQNAVGSPCPTTSGGGTLGTAVRNLYIPDLPPADGVISAAERAACLDVGHLNLHGGAVLSPPAPTPVPTNPCDRSWREAFGNITKEQMQALSDAQAANGLSNTTTPKRNVYWVTDPSPWHDSLGSATEPVSLIFAAPSCASRCPTINGSPVIYGRVYLDTQCDAQKTNGWGGATIYGTLVIDSGLNNLNANTRIIYAGNNGGLPPPLPPNFDGTKTQRVLGSWKDF